MLHLARIDMLGRFPGCISPLSSAYTCGMRVIERVCCALARRVQVLSQWLLHTVSGCDHPAREATAAVRPTGRRVETQGRRPADRAGQLAERVALQRCRRLQAQGTTGRESRSHRRTEARKQKPLRSASCRHLLEGLSTCV